MIKRQPGRFRDAAHLMQSSDKPIKDINNKRTLAEIHNDEKLAIRIFIIRAWLIA